MLERGPTLGQVEQLGNEVGGGRLAEPPRRRERRVAVASGDVEHALPGQHVQALAEQLPGQ